jgi:acyl carrier protein
MQQVFRDVFDDPALQVRDDMTAADVDGWDSLMHVTLIVSLEQAFGIRFIAAEISGLKDVAALRQVIERKLAA